MKDYYQILGISRDATTEEIKKAFHKLAHKYHPHKGGDEKKFKEINEAYQVLSNKEKRTQYDRFGRTFEGGNFTGDFDFNSYWEKGGGFGIDLEDLFGDFFHFGSKKRGDIRKGDDIEVETRMNLEDILRPQEREINISKYSVCSRCRGKGAESDSKLNECKTCRGKGEVQEIKKTFLGTITKNAKCPSCGGEGYISEKLCNVCKGEGRVKKEEEIKINIPAGVDTDQIIQLKGKGDAGRKGGSPGDLYIRIFINPHLRFKRKGDDIFTNISLNLTKLILGGEIEVPTLEKNIVLKIPAGTDSCKIFRIAKKGIPHYSGYGRGDLYVKVDVEVPKRLTRKQKKLLNELRKEGL